MAIPAGTLHTSTTVPFWRMTTAVRHLAPQSAGVASQHDLFDRELDPFTDILAAAAEVAIERRSGALDAVQVGILSEDLFRSVLVRERKRADRFDETFALATIAVRDPDGSNPSILLAPVADAVASALRDADVVGWIRQDAVLGALVNIGRPADGIQARIEARIGQELQRRVDVRTIARIDVRWSVHTGPSTGGMSESDPLLEEIRTIQKHQTLLDAIKRALDVLGSVALLALLAPVLLVIAAIVKLTSPGPVLFRQPRVGQLAKPFTMLKFRTMHAQNDPSVHRQFVTDFIKAGASQKQAANKIFKIVNDARVTPVGRFLRKTSLDELPQLWNVLKGEMSLVGPRPPLRYELEQYRPWHWRRVLVAKPGITGLWQVAGRSRTTFDEMVRLDLRYARKRSLWTDVKILLATPRAVVTGKGAC